MVGAYYTLERGKEQGSGQALLTARSSPFSKERSCSVFTKPLGIISASKVDEFENCSRPLQNLSLAKVRE